MSNVQIPNLPASVSLNGNEQLEAVQAGTSVRVTTGQIATYTQAQYPAPGVSSIATTAPITGGTITSTGTIGLQAAGVDNSYLASMAGGTVKANVTGSPAQPSDASVSSVLDVVGSTRGTVLYRGVSNWSPLLPGSANNILISNGSGADPSWQSISATLDTASGSTQGAILYRSASTWTELSPGVSGQILQTNGGGANPSWVTLPGTGTVTQINTGTGLTGGPITISGTISIANTGVSAASYGSASAVPAIAINAQGQITSAVDTAIAIPASQITSGTLGVARGGTGASSLTGYVYGNGTSAFTASTTIPNAGLQNSSLTIGSTPISLGGTASLIAGLTSLTLTQDPVNPLEAATKQYVDATIEGLNIHAPAAASTTANLTATYSNGASGVGATLTNSGAQAAFAVDGYTAALNDRILVKDQSAAAQNGVYTVTTVGSVSTNWVLTRATDMDVAGDGADQLGPGDYVFVVNGTQYAGTAWVVTTPQPIVIGTTAITFVQFAGAGTYTAGTGLTLTGTQFSIANTAVSAASYGSASSVPAITINAQGQITSATNTAIAIATSQITSGTLGVDRGGTGASSLTANGILYGSGTSAVGVSSAGATGEVLVGNTGSAPTWAALSSSAVTSFSGGTTGLTPSSATQGVITLAGTLGVANGGTGTATAFAAGSVVFAGASGVYAQDNANLFWDDTNNRLGIGTSSPGLPLDVYNATSSLIRAQGDSTVQIVAARNSTDTSAASIVMRKFRGTVASPSAAASGDTTGVITFQGYGGTNNRATAQIISTLDTYVSDTNISGSLAFNTNAGSTGTTERARITSGGNFFVNATALPAGTHTVAGTIYTQGFYSNYGIGSHSGVGGAYQANAINFQWNSSAVRLWVDTTDLGSITVSSDYRVKKDIKTQAATALDRVLQIRPVTYTYADYAPFSWKADGVSREGFIAHELAEIIPSAVEGAKDEPNKVQSLKLDALCSVLVKAIQELKADFDAYKAAHP